MSDDVPEQYRPRLCHVVKWPDFGGYGFNLHAEKGKAGQFIGKVDDDSPAEAAGLKEGDRIVEVNGVNIGNENHQQVVTRIKSGGEETRLLVVDNESDQWYKEHKQVVRGDLPEVKFISAKRDNDEEQTVPPSYAADEDNETPQEPEEPEEPTSFSVPPVENGSNGNDVNGDDTYRPRLCHMRLWPHFQGYGFNLHAERDKPGQYIGLVDDDSPASTAGLKVNDRIVEVNGVNIEAENHTEVIARIKAVPGEAKLLVVDRDTDNYYRQKNITISSTMPQTEYIATPDAADAPAQQEQVVEVESHVEELQVADDEVNQVEAQGEGEQEEKVEAEVVEVVAEERNNDLTEDIVNNEALEDKVNDVEEEENKVNDVVAEEKINDDNGEHEEENVVQEFHIPPPPPEEEPKEAEDSVNGIKTSVPKPEPEFTVASQPRQESAPKSAPVGADGLELNLSVAEMKERIKAKKKQDPRMTKVPFEQKYKEFQRM